MLIMTNSFIFKQYCYHFHIYNSTYGLKNRITKVKKGIFKDSYMGESI